MIYFYLIGSMNLMWQTYRAYLGCKKEENAVEGVEKNVRCDSEVVEC